jgi:outer membrane biosynthesis protein TonB
MDRLFVCVLAASIVLHGGAYIALARTDPPPEVTLEEIPDRYAKLLIPKRRAPVAPSAESEDRKPEAQAEPKAEKKDQPERKQETSEQVASRKAARAAAIARAVQSKGLLKVLGARGPGASGGAVADVFGPGAGMGDVASALSGAGGVAVATDLRGGSRKGGGEGGAASIGELATTGGGKVALGAKSEVRVAASVQAEEAEVDSSEVDQAKLGAFVRARMGLIKACYESALKRNPQLHGRIAVRFTILATGALDDVAAAQSSISSPEVARCIVNTMRAWRTQFRPSAPVTVAPVDRP